ncbi:MAG: YbbR-like domain-containing protein, partial [Armatimonadota bacterium]
MILPLLEAMRRNFAYKLLSLAIAVMLYLVASAQTNPRISIRTAVRPVLVGAPADLALLPESPPVAVVITGPTATVEAARTALKALLDARAAAPGRSRLPVRFQLPAGMEGTVRVEGPARVECILEARLSREFPVTIQWEDGESSDEFAIEEATASPGRARVVGWQRDLDRIARLVARTALAAQTGKEAPTVSLVAMGSDAKVVEDIEIVPANVRVRVAAKTRIAEKRLVLSPVIVGNPAAGWRISAILFEPPTIVLRGDPQRLSALASIDAEVPVEGVEEERRFPVAVTPPSGTEIVGAPSVQGIVRAVGASVAAPQPASPLPPPEHPS